ncbi:MAG TPA: porin family protein [Terriglobales bacterium]|nr:porin family protein [Terriglobales bacterium]
MKKIVSLSALLFMMCLPAMCQDESPRFEVMGGYSHATGDIGLNGWETGAGYRASKWLALVADFSGQYGSNSVLGIGFKSSLHSFLFGPRVYVPLRDNPKIMPFGHLLLGASRVHNEINNPLVGVNQTDSAFSWALGGGLDYQFRERFRVRIIQIDLLRTNSFNTGDNRARIGAGLVYQFGER